MLKVFGQVEISSRQAESLFGRLAWKSGLIFLFGTLYTNSTSGLEEWPYILIWNTVHKFNVIKTSFITSSASRDTLP